MAHATAYNFLNEYLLDACQRSLLMLDVLRQRGNNYQEHNAHIAPHVLEFKVQLVLDGRTLERPVNYLLTRILPPKDITIDPTKPPFIVVDPRAGHGPGIGGMKADSEIGVAVRAGHPCYYIGFLPEPMPGQTIEDVCHAEAIFVKEVARLHPRADSKPVLIANCQAGWQVMMMAAMNPDLAGPIMLAGSPLSFRAGVRGKNPMRYLGGMLGGSWMTALSGDLGNGLFDGAHLVKNFESLDPANTHWDKPYNVYAKVDTEAARFLGFETWWGSPVLLNAEEIQWIVDNLFIGNKLATGTLTMSDGQAIDLRAIRSPIVVFCSWGDNITPPQQALGWITDLYQDDREIIANGQTIVYTMHQSTGHLGIFVSGKVASKEHREFTQCMDLINLTPPGLYEAVITEMGEDTHGVELTDGKYLFQLKPRTLDDIRALGENSPEDEACFNAVARLSEMNLDWYRAFASPMVRAMTNHISAKAMRNLHPSRLRFAALSDANPFMKPIKHLAGTVHDARAPVSPDNPWPAIEKATASWINSNWEYYRAARDTMIESIFFRIYGSPMLQALLGVQPHPKTQEKQVHLKLAHEVKKARRQLEAQGSFEKGGIIEAVVRALAYVIQSKGAIDERGFTIIKKFRETQPVATRLSMPELKEVLKEQMLLVRLDEKRAIEAIPALLPKSHEKRQAAMDFLRNVLTAGSRLSAEAQHRLNHIEALFIHAHMEMSHGYRNITRKRA